MIDLLQGEREQWRRFGVMPGLDSVQLLIDQYAELDLTEGERAFLFIATSLVLDFVDDDERPDLQLALASMGDELLEHAEDEAMAEVLGAAGMTLVSMQTLGDEGLKLGVARLTSGIGPERTLYGLLVTRSGRAIEVVIKPDGERIAGVRDSVAAIRKLGSWMELPVDPKP